MELDGCAESLVYEVEEEATSRPVAVCVSELSVAGFGEAVAASVLNTSVLAASVWGAPVLAGSVLAATEVGSSELTISGAPTKVAVDIAVEDVRDGTVTNDVTCCVTVLRVCDTLIRLLQQHHRLEYHSPAKGWVC